MSSHRIILVLEIGGREYPRRQGLYLVHKWFKNCQLGDNKLPTTFIQLVGAQPPPNCSFARHLIGKMVIHGSFAHH